MLRNFILKHEKGVERFFEIAIGAFTWNVILFPYWGIFVIPNFVAYFVLGFNIYWFYQSFLIAISATLSHIRMQATMQYDWVSDFNTFPDSKKLEHIIIVPTVKEPLHTVERTLDSLVNQTLPAKKHITIVLATEGGVDKKFREDRDKLLVKKYAKKFANFFVTVHYLAEGEIQGKSSNERYAAIWVKENYIDKEKKDIDYIVVTSCDADHVYHPKHFAALAFKFLDNPDRYRRFWQPAVTFYNNIWKLPAITRVPNAIASVFVLSLLSRKDRLINQQNYSLSFKLLHEVDYWDPDKIPEDWGIFFKAFFAKKGHLEVEPLFLPISADAAESTSTWKTLKSQYGQIKRWAWGVSDAPWILKNFLITPGLSFWDKFTRVTTMLWAHMLWPIYWFIITIGLNLAVLINPAFGRTTLGFMVPKISSFVLTISLVFLIFLLVLDYIYKPKRPKDFPLWRAILMPFEFVLLPISGLIFGSLPALDSHTRLMLGKYMGGHKATEKV